MKLLKFNQFIAESLKSTDEYISVNESRHKVAQAMDHIETGIGWAADQYLYQMGGPLGLNDKELKELAIELAKKGMLYDEFGLSDDAIENGELSDKDEKAKMTVAQAKKMFESAINEAKYNSNTDADDIFFLWDDTVDDDRGGIEHSHGSSRGRRYSQFIFDPGERGFDDFADEVEALMKKNKWKYDFDGDVLNIYESANEGLSRVILDKDIEDDLYDDHSQFFDGPTVDDYSGNEMMVGDTPAAEKYLKANKIKYKIKNESRIEKTSDEDRMYFDFLLTLRDSGKTNMFGAAPYLERQFGMSKKEAREVLSKWMRSFNESVNEAKQTVVLNYNTDPDDIEYVEGILKDAGILCTVEAGIDSEEVEITLNKGDLKKATSALSTNGLELQESVNGTKNGYLYYTTAVDVFKKERIRLHPARIESILDKLKADGFLSYDAMFVKDAEKDILAALGKVNKIETYIR
jgi:hypothetical protein